MLIDRLKNGIMLGSDWPIPGVWFSVMLACCLLSASLTQAAEAQIQLPSRVIDGDTFVLKGGQVIRLLGINAPEVEHHGEPAEPGGWSAKRYLQQLLTQQGVYLQYDEERTDRYGRTLAQVFLPNGLHLNAEMLRHGMATLSIHPPNIKYLATLQAAQQIAEEQQLGVWALSSHRLQPIARLNQGKRWGRFSARVSHIQNTKKGAKLYLGKRHYIWVPASAYRYFPRLGTYYGRLLEVRSWPRKWGKTWSLRVIHPSQVILKPG